MEEQKQTKTDFHFIYFLLVCLLSLVVIGESIIISKMVLSSKPEVQTQTNGTAAITPVPKAKQGIMAISLVPGEKVAANKVLKVKITFNSPKTAVSGADAIIIFDPKVVAVGAVTPNKLAFKTVSVNRQQEKEGRIKITAFQPLKSLIGLQDLASLDIRLLKNQTSVVRLEFIKTGETKDSNLIPQTGSNDLLGSTVPLNLVPIK